MAEIEFVPGMNFRSGVDGLGGQVRGTALSAAAPESVAGGGQATGLQVSLAENQTDLESALEISSDLSAAVGLFGGSAKFNFAEKCKTHHYSLYLVIHSRVLNDLKQISAPQLNPDAIDLLKNGATDRFREQFGDLFVLGIRTGGQLDIVLEIEKFSDTNSNDIKGDIAAGGILGPVAGKTEDKINSVITKATTGHQVSLFQSQIGGAQTASLEPSQVIAQGLNFASTVTPDKSVPFSVVLQDYKTLDLPAPPNFVDLQNARDVISTIMDLRKAVLSKLNSAHYIIAHPEQFPTPLPLDVNKFANGCAAALKILTDAASQAINAPKQAAMPQVDVPTDALPQPVAAGSQEPVNVPDLNGMQFGAASDFLTKLGMTSTINLVPNPDPATFLKVLFQTPPAGTLPKGTNITLTCGFHKIFGQ